MERITDKDWKERFDLKELHPRYKGLAEYEDLQEKCIEASGCGLGMILMKYSEFIEDIARLHAFDSTGLTPEEISNLVTINGNLVRANDKLNQRHKHDMETMKELDDALREYQDI